MHNVPKRKAHDVKDLAVTVDILADYMDTSYNSIWIPATTLHVDIASGGTGLPVMADVVSVGVDRLPVLTMPKGAGTTVSHIFVRRPKLWVNGMCHLNIYWMTNTTTNNNYYMFGKVSAQTTGSVIAAGTSYNIAIANGTTADIFQMTDLRAVSSMAEPVNQSHLGYIVTLDRLGGNVLDTHASDFRLVGLELVYTEINKQIGTKPLTL